MTLYKACPLLRIASLFLSAGPRVGGAIEQGEPRGRCGEGRLMAGRMAAQSQASDPGEPPKGGMKEAGGGNDCAMQHASVWQGQGQGPDSMRKYLEHSSRQCTENVISPMSKHALEPAKCLTRRAHRQPLSVGTIFHGY